MAESQMLLIFTDLTLSDNDALCNLTRIIMESQ